MTWLATGRVDTDETVLVVTGRKYVVDTRTFTESGELAWAFCGTKTSEPPAADGAFLLVRL